LEPLAASLLHFCQNSIVSLGTVPEPFFEKKQLIPTLQQLLVLYLPEAKANGKMLAEEK
jgi:hypothetical protein